MSASDRPAQAAEAIEALGESPSPLDARRELAEFDAKDLAAALVSRGGGGGGLPDPITTPVNIELAADAVALSVTAAPDGSENLAEFTPSDPANAITIDSNGRFHAANFAFLSTSTSGNYISLIDDGVWDVESDETGEFLIKAQAKNGGDKLGFFNTTPVTKPNVPLTTPSVQDVIDALVALGLVEQSD